ncbi:MAG: hypothetical protein GC159_16695 [Phycisphaera sp.]|nr:hypothetical protein [Phycisphaera sp.]
MISFKDLAQGLEVVRRCRADQAEGDVRAALDRKILHLIDQMSTMIEADDRITRRTRAEQALEDAAPSALKRLEAKTRGAWSRMIQRVLAGQAPADVWRNADNHADVDYPTPARPAVTEQTTRDQDDEEESPTAHCANAEACSEMENGNWKMTNGKSTATPLPPNNKRDGAPPSPGGNGHHPPKRPNRPGERPV